MCAVMDSARQLTTTAVLNKRLPAEHFLCECLHGIVEEHRSVGRLLLCFAVSFMPERRHVRSSEANKMVPCLCMRAPLLTVHSCELKSFLICCCRCRRHWCAAAFSPYAFFVDAHGCRPGIRLGCLCSDSSGSSRQQQAATHERSSVGRSP